MKASKPERQAVVNMTTRLEIETASRRLFGAAALAVTLGLQAVGAGGSEMSWTLTSQSFTQGGEIPVQHTCEGADTSPPLVWTEPPAATKGLALIVDDPDAPDPKAPRVTWVHWVLYDLPPDSRGLSQDVSQLPAGTREGLNDWKRTGYGGPCPPVGRHRYFFKLYALDTRLGDRGPLSKADLEKAMEGHVLAETQLMGTYQKQR